MSQPLPVKTALADCTTVTSREKTKTEEEKKIVQLLFTFHFLNVDTCEGNVMDFQDHYKTDCNILLC